LFRSLGKANQFFADQVIESALCAELPANPARSSALLNPDLLESHPHQPIRNAGLTATPKLHTEDADLPASLFSCVAYQCEHGENRVKPF
jgi:hypothetical protein